jgi:hypothetical protein
MHSPLSYHFFILQETLMTFAANGGDRVTESSVKQRSKVGSERGSFSVTLANADAASRCLLARPFRLNYYRSD